MVGSGLDMLVERQRSTYEIERNYVIGWVFTRLFSRARS